MDAGSVGLVIIVFVVFCFLICRFIGKPFFCEIFFFGAIYFVDFFVLIRIVTYVVF